MGRPRRVFPLLLPWPFFACRCDSRRTRCTPGPPTTRPSRIKDTQDKRYRLILEGHFKMDRPQEEGVEADGSWHLTQEGARPCFCGMPSIFRVAVGTPSGIIAVLQVGLGMAHDAIGRQGSEESPGRFGRSWHLAQASESRAGLYRRLRVTDLPDIVGGMAILAFRRPLHPTFQHHAMAGFLVGLGRILMAIGATHFRETLRRMDVGLGFLVAVRASHPRRSMDRGFEGLLVDMKGEKGAVLFPFAEPGIFMTFQAFGIIRSLRGQHPEKQ